MPFKDPEEKRRYHREYMREYRKRKKANHDLSKSELETALEVCKELASKHGMFWFMKDEARKEMKERVKEIKNNGIL